MLYRHVLRLLGLYIIALAGVMIIPLLVAVHFEFIADPATHPQPHSTFAFIETMIVCLAIGLLCCYFGSKYTGRLFKKEVITLVVAIWFLTPAFSALPYLFSGTFTSFWDAYFESTSGITTTGSTTMEPKNYNDKGEEIPIEKTFGNVRKTHYSFYGNITPVRDPKTNAILYEGVEAVSKAILFWRSFVAWIGGLGIVVLFIAILPSLGISGKALFQVEVAGPTKDAMTPRVQTTAIHLWLIYSGLTMLEYFLLIFTNNKLGWLDAITISMGSLCTGGFPILNANIGGYHNATTDWIIVLFMFLGSLNFSLYYFALKGKFYRLYDREFIVYIIQLFAVCCICSWYLIGEPLQLLTGETQGTFSFSEAVQYGFFQVVSSQTTAGYATANYDGWPILVQALMLLIMYFGGMSGSTSGGLKIIRHLMLIRIVLYKVEELFRPKKIRKLHIGGQEISQEAATGVLCFFWLAIAISVIGTLAYIIDNIDLETSFGLVACMINNTGMSFRMAGPMDSCAFMSDFSLIVSSSLMLLGRLEFLTVLAMFVPAFWKENA